MSSSSASQSTQIIDDDQMFKDILASMGTTNYDPMVSIALNEYARSKFTKVLLLIRFRSIVFLLLLTQTKFSNRIGSGVNL